MRPFGRAHLNREDSRQDPLEDDLRTYGERYSLSPERRSSMRSTLLLEFARRQDASTASGPLPWWRSFTLRSMRPVAAATVLVILLLSGTGLAAAQSGPGQALYGLRVTLQRMAVPWATPAQRLTSTLEYLDARLSDVQSSARSENDNGIAAAIAAYEAGLQQALQSSQGAGVDPAQVARALDTRAAVLEQLLHQVPSQAQAGIENALSQTNQAGQKLKQLSASPPGPAKGEPGSAAGTHAPTSAPGQVGPGSNDNGKGNAGQPGNGGVDRGGPNPSPHTGPGAGPSHRPAAGHGSGSAPGSSGNASPAPTPTPTPTPTPGSGEG